MTDTAEFQETVTALEAPTAHHVLIVSPSGHYLGIDTDGTTRTFHNADDRVIWDRSGPTTVKHTTTGTVLHLSANEGMAFLSPEPDLSTDSTHSASYRSDTALSATGVQGTPAAFSIEHGPEKLPSDYLRFFKEHGWVCLTSILSPSIVEGLEHVACTDRFAERKFDTSKPPLNQSAAIAKTAAEPISLWLIRQYMQVDEIRLAHTPGLAILDRDDGKRNVQGWHSDFPYLWGITGRTKDARVPTATGPTVLGIQRNVCISDFTKVGGATAFKLGSHANETPPPEQWGRGSAYFAPEARQERGLPYSGPEADIVEAPGGSILLYDARTWHRAGVNRTPNKRAALLQAMTPMYVMPFVDTSGAYKSFIESRVYDDLTDREKAEIRHLMVHYIQGPAGTVAITGDPELSKLIQPDVPNEADS